MRKESSRQWRYPVVLVPKKNREWEMCNDFRALNMITKCDGYLLPWVDEILETLKRSKFSTRWMRSQDTIR